MGNIIIPEIQKDFSRVVEKRPKYPSGLSNRVIGPIKGSAVSLYYIVRIRIYSHNNDFGPDKYTLFVPLLYEASYRFNIILTTPCKYFCTLIHSYIDKWLQISVLVTIPFMYTTYIYTYAHICAHNRNFCIIHKIC